MNNNNQTQATKKESPNKETKTVNYGGLRIRSMAASSYDIWTTI